MKKAKLNIFKTLYFVTTLLLLALHLSCEGLEKWTSESNLFRHNGHSDKENEFVRYFEPALSDVPLVAFIQDNSSVSSKSCSKNIRKICDYTKIPFNIIDIDTWNKNHEISESTRVISLYDSKKLSDNSILKLLNFVANGGTLFISYANQDARMSYLYGFVPSAEFAINNTAKGWMFTTQMLPDTEGKTYMENEIHFGFEAKNFNSNIKILATAVNDANFPLIVENQIGAGKIILFNTTKDFIKADRGLIFSALLKGLEAIPYPIANVSTVFLDDFPSPQYKSKAEPIKTELNLTMSDFVKKVWWPDMLFFSAKHKIPYATMLTFDYRNSIVPPFTFDQWNEQKIRSNGKLEPLTEWFVKDAKKHNFELAFHGYNHVSLTMGDWKNQDFIGTSLQTIQKKWEFSNYGSLPTTYVPPSNIIDKYGLTALKKGIPSLKYMCSIYLGDTKEGGNREFDYDPFNKDFFDYPRISSGFYLSDDAKFNVQSMYLFTGIWTHFVHPDDVFQIPNKVTNTDKNYELRNGKNYGWYKTKDTNKSLFSEFTNLLKSQTETYPQMRFLNANDAAKVVMNWRASRYEHISENANYTVSNVVPTENQKNFWFLYGSKTNASIIERDLKNQKTSYKKTEFMQGFLYSINTIKSKISLFDLNYRTKVQKQDIAINAITIREQHASFMQDQKSFLAGTYWDELADKKEQAALLELKNKIETTPEIVYSDWNIYARKMAWIKRNNEVWEMLDNHVLKYYSKNNIMYSKQLDKNIGYRNEKDFEKWLYAQIQVSPDDKNLITTYISNFYDAKYLDRIYEMLKKLYELEATDKNYKNYIKFLLDYRPTEALETLRNESPTQKLQEFATILVWLFLDNNEFLKAYQWAELSTDFEFATKMNWLIDAKEYQLLEADYLVYFDLHPNDIKVNARMAEIFHLLGRFEDSWMLASSLPESPEKDALRMMLNKDVVFEKKTTRDFLIAHHPDLFYANIINDLIKEDRLENGDFVEFSSAVETNQKAPSIFKNTFSYNLYDKKHNIHSIGASYDHFYEIEIPIKNKFNFDNALHGLQYKFTSADIYNKAKYWTLARLQVDEKFTPYYKFGLGINHSKEKTYRSTEFQFFPVETGAAMNQKIYQLQLNMYQDTRFFKAIQSVISLEGNYYFEGLINPDTLITKKEASYNGSGTLKFLLDNGKERKIKFVPFLETQYSAGSKDLQEGYPYWMLKNRFFGGGGLGWQFRTKTFYSVLEASYFFDDFSKNFERITSNVEWQLFEYYSITINAEAFIQSKYYSNAVSFGLKHNLKHKIKKSIK